MNISMKNVSYNDRMSEETSCFSAGICVDGKKAGNASNRGQGGSTMIDPPDLGQRINAYAKTLPPVQAYDMTLEMNADMLLGRLLEQFLLRRDMKAALRKRVLFVRAGKPAIFQTKAMQAAELTALLANPKAIAGFTAETVLNLVSEDAAFALYLKGQPA